VYSFFDVQASIKGPGGNFDIASSGVSDESIRIAMSSDKNTMTIGANGDGMHSLKATTASRITISLLKTATGNALMNQLYAYQSKSSAFWGQNIITIANPVSGDAIVATGGAFVKQSDIGYSTEAGLNTWAFDFIATSEVLGNGLQNTGLAAGLPIANS
jgi:hypothetical protein